MKKISLLTALVLTVMAFMNACGGSKQAAVEDSPYGKAVATEPCIVYAEQNPTTRAWGNGEHFKLSTANNLAEMQARAKYARGLATLITEVVKEQGAGTSMYAGDDETGQAVSDQAYIADDTVDGMAKEIIKNTAVVKTSVYQKPNKQYNVFVCVEYRQSIAQMAEDIAKKIDSKLTDDQKNRIHFDMDRIRKDAEKKLSNYKGVTTE